MVLVEAFCQTTHPVRRAVILYLQQTRGLHADTNFDVDRPLLRQLQHGVPRTSLPAAELLSEAMAFNHSCFTIYTGSDLNRRAEAAARRQRATARAFHEQQLINAERRALADSAGYGPCGLQLVLQLPAPAQAPAPALSAAPGRSRKGEWLPFRLQFPLLGSLPFVAVDLPSCFAFYK